MDWQSKNDVGKLTAKLRIIMEETGKLTVSEQQQSSLKTPTVKGPMWVAKFISPAPKEDDARKLLFQAIDDLNEHNASYSRPESVPTHAEWTGFRKGVGKDEPAPAISEKEKYNGLLKDTIAPGVVMFCYGGAFYMNNQASYRKITTKLSQMTGLPVMTIHQRLAPQNPFPAALLDVFQGFLSLLTPPPGSPHTAIPASSIVLVGDSSGACLALALLQLLLTIRRKGITSVQFHGQKVNLDLPAGLTLLSAATELTHCLPSYKSNYPTDAFPADLPAVHLPGFPTCPIWPSNPPRGNLYCESDLLDHPLVSPTTSRDWTGAPPLWFVSGQEQIIDGAKLIAKTASGQGVKVRLAEFEAMPHTFMWRFFEAPQYEKCWCEWAGVCKGLVEGREVESRAVFAEVEGLKEREVEINSLVPFTVDEAREMMRKATQKFIPYPRKKRVGAVL